MVEQLDEKTILVAVADGMGGAEAGEIASALAIRCLYEFFKEQSYYSPFNLKRLISEAFDKVQLKIASKIIEEPEVSGLGTTLTCLIIHEDKYAWGNLGDSRAYRIDQDGCTLLTSDHTYLNQLFQQGKITLDETEINKYGHVLTRVIDGGRDVPDIYPEKKPYEYLRGDELFFLCSDGAILPDAIDSSQWVLDLIVSSNDIRDFVENIINFAFIKGSTDNISVAAVNVGYHFKNSKRNGSSTSISHKNKKFYTNQSKGPGKILRILAASLLFSAVIIITFISYPGTFNRILNYIGGQENLSSDPPHEPYVVDSNIDSVPTNLLRDSLIEDREFFELIQKGDESFGEHGYKKALDYYLKAKVLNPADETILYKISQTQRKISFNDLSVKRGMNTGNNSPTDEYGNIRIKKDLKKKESKDTKKDSFQTGIIKPTDTTLIIKPDTTSSSLDSSSKAERGVDSTRILYHQDAKQNEIDNKLKHDTL